MNVLLTCAGRRNYLVRYFRQALRGRGKVLAADLSLEAPALQEADGAFLVPAVSDPGYCDRLLALCGEQAVGLVVPLNDLELPVLAAGRARFEAAGVRVVVSSPDVIRRSFDKWETFEFLRSGGIPVPTTYRSLNEARAACRRGVLRFPLVVKPRWGTASIGIHTAEDEEELELAHRFARKQVARSIIAGVSAQDPERSVLIQECLKGEEYGLDVVNDLDGRHRATLIRRKLGMRAGETDRAVTCDDAAIVALGARLGEFVGHVGNLDCDLIRGTGGWGILDMNPRFGGGYPFVHAAGADLPAAILAWAEGTSAAPEWLTCRTGVTSCKHDNIVVLPSAGRTS